MQLREPLKTGTVLAGKYRIDQVLGAGGFGITYLANSVEDGRAVAIKEYFPAEFALRDATRHVRARSGELGETFRWGYESFIEEAQMLARFDHPAITRVLGVIEANDTAYMVLRYEEGLPLSQHLAGLGRPMTEIEIRRLLYPLLEALDIIHAQGVLHRDISPENIIVRPDGRGVLIDFGAARKAVAEKSQLLTGIVREGYSAPEQYTQGGARQGPWTDIYSLGAVLYHIVSGEKPITSMHRMIEDALVPVSTLAGERLAPGLLAAIDQALRLRYAERLQDVAAFRQVMGGPGAAVTLPARHGLASRGVEVVRDPDASGSATRAAGEQPGWSFEAAAFRAPQAPSAAVVPEAMIPVRAPAPTPEFDWMPLGRLLFSFRGRINRGKVWLGAGMVVLCAILGLAAVGGVAAVAGELDGDDAGPVTKVMIAAWLLANSWMAFAVYAKRAHDRGWSGWFSLVLLVPFIQLWAIIELFFLPGSPASNRYGASLERPPRTSTPEHA